MPNETRQQGTTAAHWDLLRLLEGRPTDAADVLASIDYLHEHRPVGRSEAWEQGWGEVMDRARHACEEALQRAGTTLARAEAALSAAVERGRADIARAQRRLDETTARTTADIERVRRWKREQSDLAERQRQVTVGDRRFKP